MSRTVILYNPLPSPTPRPGAPLPLLALARMLPEAKYRTVIVNARVDRRPHRRVLEEARNGALLLGITAMTGYQIRDALRLARQVRRGFPELPIVWGGYHPSLLPKETLRDPGVDFVVRGQGERPFVRLAELLSQGAKVDGIPGVAALGLNGLPPDPPESMDAFPFLSWDLIDLSRMPRAEDEGFAVGFYTSQGCPYSCAFCAEPAMHGRRRVTMSPGRAVDEIEFLTHRGVRAVHLRDTLFFANRHWVQTFCEEVLHRNLRVSFHGVNGRVDQLMRFNEEQWRLMDLAGFREIFLGIESGHQPALDKMTKDIQPEESVQLMDRLGRSRIKASLSAMIGIPGVDPEAEFQETVSLLRRLVAMKPGQVSSAYLFSYAPYPGSGLYDEAIGCGFHPPETLERWGRLNLHTTRLPWGSRRRRRHAWLATQYVIPRILGREPSRIRLVESVSRAFDPFLRRRWESGRFDAFWEVLVYGGFNVLRRMRRSVASMAGD